MKSLKEKKEIILTFIIGVILASSVTVYATGYFAKDITYKEGKTVEQALNDLYSKMSNTSITCLESENKVSSISCSVGDYFLIHTIYGSGGNIDGLSGAQVIASSIGPDHNGVDSHGVLVRATSTTISASNQFGYIKLGIQ